MRLPKVKREWWQRCVKNRKYLRVDSPIILPDSCPICNFHLDYSWQPSERSVRKARHAAELNRIIPGGHYEYGNVECVCRRCNRRLQDSTTEDLLQLAAHKLRQEGDREQHRDSPQAPHDHRPHQPGGGHDGLQDGPAGSAD